MRYAVYRSITARRGRVSANGKVVDPVGSRHGLGQPFAWDFGYNYAADPDGTTWGKIYAARAGTIIDLRDGVTAEIDGVAERMALM